MPGSLMICKAAQVRTGEGPRGSRGMSMGPRGSRGVAKGVLGSQEGLLVNSTRRFDGCSHDL